MNERGLLLEGVYFSYWSGTSAERQVLQGVNLALRPGEILCLMGPTGAGKSTLLQVMAGLLPPDSGKVSCDGQPPGRSPARVGLLLQNPEQQLFAETVERDVGFGPRMAGLRGRELRCRVESALKQVGLEPCRYGKCSPFALSGGEMRRVALAGVLALDPVYLLLDEPFSGLDGPSQDRLREILLGLRERGRGILVVTHEWEEVKGMADRVAVLAEGRIVLEGIPEAVARQSGELSRAGIHPPELFRLALHLGLDKTLDSPFLSPHRMADILEEAMGGRGEATSIPSPGEGGTGAENAGKPTGRRGWRPPRKG